MNTWSRHQNGNIFRVTGHFVRRIHRSPVNSPHKGQWRGALIFSLICARINSWVNNREVGDLRRHRVHHDVIVNEVDVAVWQSWLLTITKCLFARVEPEIAIVRIVRNCNPHGGHSAPPGRIARKYVAILTGVVHAQLLSMIIAYNFKCYNNPVKSHAVALDALTIKQWKTAGHHCIRKSTPNLPTIKWDILLTCYIDYFTINGLIKELCLLST